MPDTHLDRLVDSGLDALMADEPAMTDQKFDRGREQLLTAMRAEAPAPRRHTRWLSATAAGVVLAAGLLVAQTLDFGGAGGGPPRAAAAPVLNKAAGLVANAKDQQVGPGQYLYVSTRSEGITFYDVEGEAVYRSAKSIETWIPADPRDAWMERRAEIGKPRWLPGHEGDGPPPGEPAGFVGEWRAPCGAFGYWAQDSKPSCDQGSWTYPTAEFLAGLPKDPRQLYKRLLADSGTEADAVLTVGDVLGTGRVPAEYRALLYRAIAHAPNLRVTEQVATLDGRTGTALGVDAYGQIRDFIIDPDTGEFIGYREVLSEEEHGMPAGTVRAQYSTTTTVVDEAGAK